MQAYLLNLDTVNVTSTMDTVNSSGSYVGGKSSTTITSGENAIGTFGHVQGNYTNTSSSSADSSSGTAGQNALQKALDHQPSTGTTKPTTSTTSTTSGTDYCAWGCLIMII